MQAYVHQTNKLCLVVFTPTTLGGRGTPTPTVVGTPVNTDRSPPTPSGPQGSSTEHANMLSDGKYLTNMYEQHLKNREQRKSRNVEIKPH